MNPFFPYTPTPLHPCILRKKWYNYTTHAGINARSSQAKVFSSVITVVQRDRLAFMLGIKHNRQFIKLILMTNYVGASLYVKY